MGMGRLFNKTATVKAPTYAKQSDGSVKRTGTTDTAVPAALLPKSATASWEYQRQYGVEGLDIFLPYSYAGATVSVPAGSEIVIDGATYRVRGPAQDMGGAGDTLKVNVDLPK